MVEIQISYDGALRTTAVHGPSDATLITDAPVDNHGKGESFSPTDLLATALGSCMLTIMGIAADKRGIAIEGTRVQVTKTMVKDPHRRIGSLSVILSVPGTFTDDDKTALEQAALSCPVHHSLHPNVEITLDWRWDN